MKALKTILLAGATLALIAGGAFAQETISLSADFNGNPLGSVNGVTGGTATIGGSSNGNVFSITSVGVPSIPNPDFATTTIDANVTQVNGGVLTILATQQNLTNFPGGLFSATFAADFLIGDANVSSIVMSAWIDPGNGAFALTNLIGSQSCSGVANNCAPVTDLAFFSGLGTFSETEKFVITFTGPAGVIGNAEIAASAVPEPATWGMMLLGFAGLGFAFRRKLTASPLAA
jgi:PEP-CTERM motif